MLFADAARIVDALVDAGHYVVAIDARGHGNSDKPHDPDRYGENTMSRDLSILLETVADLGGVDQRRLDTVVDVLLTDDEAEIAASPAIPGARCRTVAGDHLGAIREPEFTDAIVGFFARAKNPAA